MKNKFPPDVLFVLFAPVLIGIVVIVVGGIITHAARFGGPVTAYVVAAAIALGYIAFLIVRLRRRL